MTGFDYLTAFSRNIGWVREGEQIALKGKKVAIAGLGGVGGSHLLTLARLGVGRFSIADMDSFDWANMNRQAGAFASTIGKEKIEILAAMARDINPEVSLDLFSEGITPGNVDSFLEGADLYLDGLDVFCMDMRRMVFARCRDLRIPAVTAAPVGMGSSLLVFSPDGMSYEEYFNLSNDSFEDQVVKFVVGVSPSMMQKSYLVQKGTFSARERKAPSTPMGIDLAAGLACVNVLKILLGRGEVRYAPHGLHFDAYLNKMRRTWVPFGNKNPLQRLKVAILKFIMTHGKGR